jgi:hypothetical protein
MFVSSPDHEFRVPRSLAARGIRYWRLVRLSGHLPWFLATYTLSNENNELLHTICVASETDLVQIIESTRGLKMWSLLLMTPGWLSEDGQWQARDIRAIGRARSARGEEVILFRDCRGVEFVDPLCNAKLELLTDPQLIADMSPVPGARQSCP